MVGAGGGVEQGGDGGGAGHLLLERVGAGLDIAGLGIGLEGVDEGLRRGDDVVLVQEVGDDLAGGALGDLDGH